MAYTVWIDGLKVGDTSLELSHDGARRAGVFHPSVEGLALLPRITAMARALLDAGRMCREIGIDTEDPDLDVDSATEAVFATPEGRRIQEAAQVVARLELHDPRGELVEWESLLISDVNDFRGLAESDRDGARQQSDQDPGSDPIRYLISATLRASHRGGTRDPHGRRTRDSLPQ